MKNLYQKILAIAETEQERLILWIPVFIAFGIVWYFSLKYEPPIWLGSAILTTSILFAYLLRKIRFLFYLLIAFALVAFGISLAQFRTHNINSPFLSAPMPVMQVSGKIKEISATPKGSKIILGEVKITSHDKIFCHPKKLQEI